jgi:hypothetical protein
MMEAGLGRLLLLVSRCFFFGVVFGLILLLKLGKKKKN